MTKKNERSKVFLIGDSIAGGYAERVRELLVDLATVEVRPENGEDSRNVLSRAPHWLEGKRFHVIHFNCGLHDFKRYHGSGSIQVPLSEYGANLGQIIALLGQYAEILIWARTTPVIDGQPASKKGFDRFNRDVEEYNRVADRVMAARSVLINDLHGAIVQAGVEKCLSNDGVHMTEFGYQVLGNQVGNAILSAIRPAAPGLEE
jgi:acyl-CoA thioesterase-1